MGKAAGSNDVRAGMDGFEALARGVYLEGLAVDRDGSTVWFSDVIGGGVHGICANGARRTFDPLRKWTGGVLLNRCGAVLSSGEGGIRWNHPVTGRSGWLLDRIDGVPVNGINEMAPDGRGGMYFGTCDIERIKRAEPPRPTGIWHLSAERRLRCVADPIGFANGMIHDTERQRLYCNDSFSGTWVFDVDAGFALGNRRRFCDKYDADGMALDAEGNVWITGFSSSAISRLAPDGRRLDRFPTPGGAVTQLRFAGSDLCDLYITTVPADGGENLKEGKALEQAGSVLYRTRSPWAGRRVGTTSFDLDCDSATPPGMMTKQDP